MTQTWVAPKCFDDLQIGDVFHSPGRTVTECEISHFFMLSGAFEELFTNREFVEKESIFKRRIAQGALTFIISLGLGVQSGWMHGTVMAMLGIDELRWPQPVYENDTIKVSFEVVERRQSASNQAAGIVRTRNTVVNQHGDPVLIYMQTLLMRKRSPEYVSS